MTEPEQEQERQGTLDSDLAEMKHQWVQPGDSTLYHCAKCGARVIDPSVVKTFCTIRTHTNARTDF